MFQNASMGVCYNAEHNAIIEANSSHICCYLFFFNIFNIVY